MPETASKSNEEINFLKGCLLVSDVIPNGLQTLLKTKTDDLSADCYDFYKLCYALQHSKPFLTQGIAYLINAREELFQYLSENSMSNAELETLKQKISKGFVELDLPLDDINNIVKIPTFSEIEVLTAHEQLSQEKRMFCSLGPRCYHPTIQRSKEIAVVLKELEELNKNNPKCNSTVFIDGDHGCGKSVLAKQVAKHLYDKNQTHSMNTMAVMVLNAETEETLLFSYVQFAKEILCNFTQVEMAITSLGLTLGERIRLLKCITGIQLKKYSNWVVVVDNVNHFEQDSVYWPTPGSNEWGFGNIIVTLSDVKNIEASALDSASHVNLSHGMQPSDVIELLSIVSNVAIKEDLALKVAEVLEFNPLALSCVAVFVRSLSAAQFVDCHWKTYLELFNKYSQVHQDEVSQEDFSQTSLIAIQMLIRQVLSHNHDIPDITYLVSLFYPFPVRKETVSYCMKNIFQTNLEKCFQDLSPFILVTESQADVESVSLLHQLQDIYPPAVEHVNERRQVSILGSAMTSLAHQLSKLENHRSFVNLNIYCLSHGASLLAWKVRNLSDNHQKELVIFLDECGNDAVDTFVRVAEQCHAIQKPEHAIALLQIAKHILEDMQDNSVTSLKRHLLVFHHLGCIYRDMGYADARNYLEKVLHLYQEEKEVPHERVANVLEALGDVCVASNNTSNATMFYTKALETHPDHTSGVALSWYKLGNVLALQGSFQAAKDHYEKALESLDNANSDTVSHSLVKVLTCAGAMSVCVGDYKLAKKYLERAMRLEERLFSKFHPCRLSSIKNAANACTALRDYDSAESHLRESLEISQRVIGRLDADVAQVYSELGSLRAAQDDWKSAIDYYNSSLEIRENTILCQLHPEIANSCCDLGHAYTNLGELEKAKSFHERALGIRGLLFKGHHPDIGKSYFRLGKVYNKLGDSQTALSLLERAVEIRGNVFGVNHPETLASMYHLGQSFARIGQLSNAKKLFQAAADGQQKLPGCKLDLAKTSASLAEVNLALGKTDIAKQQFSRAIELQKSETGPDDPDVARPLVRLALVHEHCKEMGQAKTLLEMALVIYRKSVGKIGNSHVLITEAHLKRVISKLTQKRCIVM